jgi:hypothetical protein
LRESHHDAVGPPRHRAKSSVALVAAVGLAAAALAAPADTQLTQAEAEASVTAVVPELQKIRGFAFRDKVPVTVIDDRKAREYALARFRRLTPEAKLRADQSAFRLLGLVPADLDVLKTLLDVLEEQAGGYYDPGTKSFYLLADMPKEMTALLAAHEMTHALEDQRYDIDGRLAKVIDDDDASFALSALVEGSATIASAVYVSKAVAAGRLDPDKVGNAGQTVPTERLNAMPEVLRRQLLGPYVLGMSFLARGRVEDLQAGFPKDDVDAAWARPPRSSEQILHPEKYWNPSRRDDPKRVAMPNPSGILGKGWVRSGSGVLGELTLGSLVGARTPEPAELASGDFPWTNAAASGWGGDRYEVWTRGDSVVVVVVTVWDTETDAVEFAAALPRDRANFAFRRAGSKVGIVAGASGDRREALLSLLVKP